MIKISQACRLELERELSSAFEAFHQLPDYYAAAPFIGDLYAVHAVRGYHRDLRKRVFKALLARERHRLSGPPDLQPLPLSEAECDALQRSGHNKIRLLGYFGESLRAAEWNRRHPTCATYCAAVLAIPYNCMENDRELLARFPPEASGRLSSRDLHWRV
jgi:hypothetical protein